MNPEPQTLRTVREQTIDTLCRHFARDELTMGELERRLERARTARSRSELTALLSDLRTAPLPEGPRARSQPAKRDETAPRKPERPADTPAPRPGSSLAFAVMGGTRRAGHWAPPATMNAVAIMGGVELDFREAVLSSGVTEITCFTFWGGIEITVPPDVHVDTHGFALMGAFDQSDETESKPDSDAPTIRITGMALMGGVEVKVVERGAKASRPDW